MKITTNNAVEAQIICAKRDFVEEIFDILGKEDMLLSDLARAAHMSRTQIYLQLGGAPNSTLRTLCWIAHALGCRVRITLEPLDGQQEAGNFSKGHTSSEGAPSDV